MFNLGVPELILILVVGLVVFGPKKLPEVGRSVGKGLREFKKAMNDIKQTIDLESEFKEVAEIKKEVTDIKDGLKEVVLGPDVPAGSQVSTSPGQSSPAETADSGAEVEDPRQNWINNSNKEWTMPEWISQTDDESPELQTPGEPHNSEKKNSLSSEQKAETAEKEHQPGNEERTT